MSGTNFRDARNYSHDNESREKCRRALENAANILNHNIMGELFDEFSDFTPTLRVWDKRYPFGRCMGVYEDTTTRELTARIIDAINTPLPAIYH